jgi:hypothetical protein
LVFSTSNLIAGFFGKKLYAISHEIKFEIKFFE